TRKGCGGTAQHTETAPGRPQLPRGGGSQTAMGPSPKPPPPAGLLLSADVVTNWQGPWYAPSQAYVDQYNLMTYGANVARIQADVATTVHQGLPASKFVVGIDVVDDPPPSGGCGQFSSYAAQAGLMGAFVWTARSDPGNACANGLAAGS